MREPVRIGRAVAFGLFLLVGLSLGQAGAAAPQQLSLELVLQRVDRHPDVVQAESDLTRAERDLEARLRAFAPQASVEATPLGVSRRGDSWGRDNPTFSLSASRAAPSGTQASVSLGVTMGDTGAQVPSWNVSVSHPLLRNAELSSANQAVWQAQSDVEQAHLRLTQARQMAEIDVVRLYAAAQAMAATWLRAQEAYEDAQASYAAVLHRSELGLASDLERLEAETQLRREELAVLQAERNYHERMRALLAAVDLPGEPDDYVLDALPEVPKATVGIDPDALTASALEFDPTLRQRKAGVEAAQRQLDAAKEQLGLEGSVRAGMGKARDASEPTWSIQLQFGYTLLDGGAARANVEEREDALESAVEAYDAAREQVIRQIDQYVAAVKEAEMRVEIAELALQVADMELKQATAAHALGVLDDAGLRSAERTFRGAQGELAQARLEQWLAIWEAYAAALLDPEEPISAMLSKQSQEVATE